MNLQAAPDYFELSDYVSVLRRRWRTIIAAAVAGLVLAGAFYYLGPRKYTATVLVQVNALPNNANAVGGRTGGPVNMDNEGQAVQSAAVASIVKSHLHSPLSVTDLIRHIHVTVPPNSTYLQITCDAPTAIGAQQCANAVGNAYLFNRRASIETLIGTGIKALRAEAARLRTTIEHYKVLLYTTRHKKGTLPGSPALVGDTLQLNAAQNALATVESHIDAALPLYDSMAVPGSTVAGSIASPASLPTAPSSPRKLLILPSGLILGLIVGLAWAFARDRRNKRVHTARDVERLGSRPTLLNLAATRQGPVTTVESPRSAAGRAFTELAEYFGATLGDGSHVLAVAATSPGSSGSVVAANLAAALARTTDQTVLVCGDLQGTRVPEVLGIARGRGMSELITGASQVSEVLRPVADRPGLGLVPPGFDAARAVAVMQHGRVKQLIADLLGAARYVVIEVQSAGENSDTFSLAQFAESAIVAVEVERSRPADITACVERLARLGTPVLGTAVLKRGPAIRRSQDVQTPQDRSDLSSISRYQMQPDRGPGQQPSPGAATWSPRTPQASSKPQPSSKPPPSGPPQEVAGLTAATHGVKETWPMPRVPATERDRYPNPADPATGD